MFTDEHAHYSLLARGNSGGWNLDKKTVILISAITLPVFIFCATYMTIFGIYQKVIYPRTRFIVPKQSVHRAVAYNTFLKKLNNVTSDLHLKSGQNNVSKRKLVCYYNFPSNAQSLQVENLDPFLCTHINVAFADVVDSTVSLNEKDKKTLRKMADLKKVNGDLKILLSVGGGGSTTGYPQMVFNHTSRESFIKSTVECVKNFSIDGVDIDWEFPNEAPGKDKHQRTHFTQLLEEFRRAIDHEGSQTFLLSVAVASPSDMVKEFYDVSDMNQYVDYVNLMSYDYHYYTKVTPFTGINAPLFASADEKFYLAQLNINYSANYWNSLGMDRSKIIVGLPTYGHSFRLTNARNDGMYAPSSGYGRLGSQGFADYAQVCSFLSSNHISPVFDMDTRSPYASKFSEWISFDNAESLTYKAEYIRDNNFGGAMVYSLNSDDYRGICGAPEGNKDIFPLTNVVKSAVGKR